MLLQVHDFYRWYIYNSIKFNEITFNILTKLFWIKQIFNIEK